MKYIRSLFETKYRIYWAILVCITMDAFFFYSGGVDREYSSNQAYFEFIGNFPESIGSARLEPLFITISYLLSLLLGSKIAAIILLKNALIAAQLFVFYKMVRLFVRHEPIALLSVFFLNFSFAYISLADNLLRNHSANLFFLLALYFVFKALLRKGRPSKNILFASLSGGLLIYTHILPTIIFDFSLFFVTLIMIIMKMVRRHSATILSAPSQNRPIKTLLLVGAMVFSIQVPYMIRLNNTHADFTDYKSIHTIASPPQPDQQKDHLPIIEKTIRETTESIFIHAKEIFRIVFEYRLPGLSIFNIFLVFVAIILVLRSVSPASPEALLLTIWGMTYLGSKADIIFGIETIPYRFSLMLIFPTIILLIILIDRLSQKIRFLEGKILFQIVILLSFLGTNIPIISETTILKNQSDDTAKSHFLQSVYNEAFDRDESRIFLMNGDSFEKFSPSSAFLLNDSIFTSTDENEIIRFMKEHRVNYVIYDQNRINEKGTGIGSIVNTNLKTYEQSNYFERVGEYMGNGAHITLFRFHPEKISIKKPIVTSIECDTEKSCKEKLSDELLASKSKITTWKTEIRHTEKVIVHEYVFLQDGQQINIQYTGTAPANNRFLQQASVKFFDFEQRPMPKQEITISVDSALFLLRHDGISISFKNLEKYSVNKFIFSGYSEREDISYTMLTRNGYSMMIRVIFLAAILILFASTFILQKIRRGTGNLLAGNSKTETILLASVVTLSVLDMILINTFFLEAYKKILGVE
jgi:hypothetical protein